jgi:DNA-binding transcriptional ArsR family regulator
MGQQVGHHTASLEIKLSAAIVSQMANNSAVLDSVFHALADPTRRAVLQRLGKGPATMSELAEPFNMALPSFLKHVGVLERTGMVSSWKNGRIRTCRLERKPFQDAEAWLDDQRALWSNRYKNLDGLLQKLRGEDHES